MFGWVRPKCPVQPELKLWIERRMAWLTDHFGWNYLTARQVILPSDEYFPDLYNPNEQGARTILDRLCGYMDVDPDRVDLHFYSNRSAPELQAGTHAAGLYEENQGRHVVTVEESQLLEPAALAATLTHELAHAVLLSNGHLHGNETDHEPLTDLFTVFQGLGALTANAFLRDANYRFGNWEGWSISRLGYLGFDAFSYALALFAWVRQERGKNWEPSLRSDVRALFRRSRRYLERTEDSTFSRSSALRPEWSVTYPSLPKQDQPNSDDPRESIDQEVSHSVDDEESISVDDTFSCGVLALNARSFVEAVDCFTSVIQEAPEDEEAYLHRGEAYLGLKAYDNAFEDACTCVELDPDDVDGVFLRGRALAYLEAYEDAAADFEYLIRQEGRGIEGVARKWRYHYWRGRLFVVEGEPQKALKAFNRAVNFAPLNVEPFIHRSRLHEQMGREDEARADLEMAFQLDAEAAELEFGPLNP